MAETQAQLFLPIPDEMRQALEELAAQQAGAGLTGASSVQEVALNVLASYIHTTQAAHPPAAKPPAPIPAEGPRAAGLPGRRGVRALMERWIAEDAALDAAQQDAEWTDLQRALNANRAATGDAPLFP